MIENKLLIDYNGVLTFDAIGELLITLKQKMVGVGERLNTHKRLITIVVETLENICKYFELFPEYAEYAAKYHQSFKLEYFPGKYKITVRNPINKVHAGEIKGKIDLINSLDADELKALYRKTIANGKFSKSGGAGLGFIEMAKAADSPIVYNFEPIDDTFTYYSICLELNN